MYLKSFHTERYGTRFPKVPELNSNGYILRYSDQLSDEYGCILHDITSWMPGKCPKVSIDDLYIKKYSDSCHSMWIASKSAQSDGALLTVNGNGSIGQTECHYTDIGIRPIVYLFSIVALKLNDDGIYDMYDMYDI